MYFKRESFPGRCTGNAFPARRPGPWIEGGPTPASNAEPGDEEIIGRPPVDGRADVSPGVAMRKLYQELGVRNILLVEADEWTKDSLGLFFQIEGCRLRAASNAEEAIAALSEGRFDLIISEYWLPDMDGLSLLKLYGNRQPGAVKILVSAYLTHHAVEEATRCGIHEVIRKPFNVETLEDSLKRHFPRSRGRGREPVGTV